VPLGSSDLFQNFHSLFLPFGFGFATYMVKWTVCKNGNLLVKLPSKCYRSFAVLFVRGGEQEQECKIKVHIKDEFLKAQTTTLLRIIYSPC
jgi:hypothetical protein